MKKFKSRLIAFSAPSGAGKTSLIKSLVARHKELVISISATTRQKRQNEIDKKDYFFISETKFKEEIESGSFLEFEQVHGDFYGTLKKTVDDYLQKKKIVVFDIDVNGACLHPTCQILCQGVSFSPGLHLEKLVVSLF